jgi:hypothetical protein
MESFKIRFYHKNGKHKLSPRPALGQNVLALTETRQGNCLAALETIQMIRMVYNSAFEVLTLLFYQPISPWVAVGKLHGIDVTQAIILGVVRGQIIYQSPRKMTSGALTVLELPHTSTMV